MYREKIIGNQKLDVFACNFPVLLEYNSSVYHRLHNVRYRHCTVLLLSRCVQINESKFTVIWSFCTLFRSLIYVLLSMSHNV